MKLLQAGLLLGTFAFAAAGQNPANDAKSQYSVLPSEVMQGDLIDPVGVRFNLDEYRGKVVLLHLWGTWCGPAVAEMPDLTALQNTYQPEGLEIIGVNMGDGSGKPEPWKLIRRFVTQKGISYRIVKAVDAKSYINGLYGLTKAHVVPQAFLIDRDGKLRGTFVGGGPRTHAKLRETVEQVVREAKHPRP